MHRSVNDRIVGVLVVGLFLLVAIWVRCVWLQTLTPHRYLALARRQQRTTQSLRANRGVIYDRNGRVLAISMEAPSVYANARRIKNKSEMAHRLANITGTSEKMIKQRLSKDKGFVWIARQLDPSVESSIRSLQRFGVGVREEPKRIYPHGQLASHIIGFVDIDQKGLEGIELTHNGVLQGQEGWRSTLKDAKGDLLIGPWTSQTQPVDGYDVVLTIDTVVQQVVEETLDWATDEFNAKGGYVVVMDPSTGEVLAMASRPSYDANEPGKVPTEYRRNRAVTDLFEPGSVMKVLTAAALLEDGLITPEERLFCENGEYSTVGRHILHDHTPHGTMTFHDIIRLSSNIGVAKAAQRLAPEKLYSWMRAFGLGSKTGIDVPGEVSGILSKPEKWSKLTPYMIPIGQEIAVTPIQLAVMTSVIANGGERVQPYIIQRVQTSEGQIIRSTSPKLPERIISTETAAMVQHMMSSVVESGTGRLAKVQGLTVAGKTGTAQKVESNGRYSHSQFVASFVGFGPVPDSQNIWGSLTRPKFVIVISMDEPHPIYFGGQVSAPMFKRIVEQLRGYWELDKRPFTEPDVVGIDSTRDQHV